MCTAVHVRVRVRVHVHVHVRVRVRVRVHVHHVHVHVHVHLRRVQQDAVVSTHDAVENAEAGEGAQQQLLVTLGLQTIGRPRAAHLGQGQGQGGSGSGSGLGSVSGLGSQ